MRQTLAVAAAIIAIAAMQALAQTMPPGPQAEQVRFVDALQPNEVMASELKNAEVLSPKDAALGTVADVVLDGSGQIRAVVLNVGGVLGIGAKTVAVPFAALTITSITPGPGAGLNRDRDAGGGRQDWATYHRITLRATKGQLKAAPDFNAARTLTVGSLGTAEGGLRAE